MYLGFSNFTIIDSKYTVIESVNIIPSKGNLYRNIDPSLIPFKKGPLYELDQDYPSSIFSLSQPYIHEFGKVVCISLGFVLVRPTKKYSNGFENFNC